VRQQRREAHKQRLLKRLAGKVARLSTQVQALQQKCGKEQVRRLSLFSSKVLLLNKTTT
jgi:hypothetical protein